MDAQAPRPARTQAQTRDGAPGDKYLAREQHVGPHGPAGSQDVGGGEGGGLGEGGRVAVDAAAEGDAETAARELGVLASGGPHQSIKVVYNGEIRRYVRALVCVFLSLRVFACSCVGAGVDVRSCVRVM